MLVSAFAGVVFLAFDVRQPNARQVVAWRLSWIAVLLAGAALQRLDRPRVALASMHAAALWSGVAGAQIVHVAGGSAYPGFGFLMALPLLVLVLVPIHPWAAVLTGAATLTGGVLILRGEPRAVSDALQFALLSAGLTVVAAMGAVGFRRVWLAEIGARTGRRIALEQLVEADRVALAGQLGAAVAHEIANPISYVSANLRFAQDGLRALLRSDDAQAGEVAASIEEASQGAARISRLVKDLAILGSGPLAEERERVDLARAVRAGVAVVLAGPHRVELAAEPEAGLAVRGSTTRVVQVVVHLVGMAVEAAGDGAASRALTVRTGERGDRVVIEVAGGPGRLAATASEPGDAPDAGGVRLWICRAAVAEMGGTLEVEPAPGDRALLRVVLPRAP